MQPLTVLTTSRLVRLPSALQLLQLRGVATSAAAHDTASPQKTYLKPIKGPHVVVSGFLPRDVELRTFASGKIMVRASLGVNDTPEDRTAIKWINMKMFKDVAKAATETLRKGSNITASGCMYQEQWTSVSGEAKTAEFLYVESFTVEERAKNQPQQQQAQKQ